MNEKVIWKNGMNFNGTAASGGIIPIGGGEEQGFKPTELVMIGEVQKDGMFKILQDKGFVKPVAWNQYVPETKGYTCDWTQKRPDAGKFKM